MRQVPAKNGVERAHLAFGHAQSGESVGGFTALRDDDDDVVVLVHRSRPAAAGSDRGTVHHGGACERSVRSPVAKLAGILNLDTDVGQRLQQVFSHQRRVPACPARAYGDL